MKKTLAFLLLLAIIIMPANAVEKENVKPVKNVILLIPDGTSLATRLRLSLSPVGCNGTKIPANRN